MAGLLLLLSNSDRQRFFGYHHHPPFRRRERGRGRPLSGRPMVGDSGTDGYKQCCCLSAGLSRLRRRAGATLPQHPTPTHRTPPVPHRTPPVPSRRRSAGGLPRRLRSAPSRARGRRRKRRPLARPLRGWRIATPHVDPYLRMGSNGIGCQPHSSAARVARRPCLHLGGTR